MPLPWPYGIIKCPLDAHFRSSKSSWYFLPTVIWTLRIRPNYFFTCINTYYMYLTIFDYSIVVIWYTQFQMQLDTCFVREWCFWTNPWILLFSDSFIKKSPLFCFWMNQKFWTKQSAEWFKWIIHKLASWRNDVTWCKILTINI